MAIVAADIKFKLSVTSGAAGNSTGGTPAGSVGKYISTTELSGTALNNLFDDVSGDENAASDVEYRCVFVHNSHATLTYTGAVVWLSAETAGGASAALAIDDIAASAIGSAGAQADLIANEDTAPGAGVGSFSAPTSKATGLSLGDIPAGQCRAFWVKRTAANTAALDTDGCTFSVAGDTAA